MGYAFFLEDETARRGRSVWESRECGLTRQVWAGCSSSREALAEQFFPEACEGFFFENTAANLTYQLLLPAFRALLHLPTFRVLLHHPKKHKSTFLLRLLFSRRNSFFFLWQACGDRASKCSCAVRMCLDRSKLDCACQSTLALRE